MSKRQLSMIFLTAALTSAAAVAHAQSGPVPGLPDAVPDGGSGSAAAAGSGSGAAKPATVDPYSGTAPIAPYPDSLPAGTQPTTPAPDKQIVLRVRPHVEMPEILTAPTGNILPAAMIYWRSTIDTGGGASTDARVGLGDVAEFGLATTDLVRAHTDNMTDDAKRIQPYVTATFRMGLSENRLFDNQPAIALGFRKSFERDVDGYATRIAELHLVASKHFGSRTMLHLGGVFWDASITNQDPTIMNLDGANSFTLHQNGLGNQLRAFGGLEVKPLDAAVILVDLSWAPEFCYAACTATPIRLRPVLSWGVRYEIADWIHLESGVRVQDIGNADLLDAQIFGQVTFISGALRRVVEAVR